MNAFISNLIDLQPLYQIAVGIIRDDTFTDVADRETVQNPVIGCEIQAVFRLNGLAFQYRIPRTIENDWQVRCATNSSLKTAGINTILKVNKIAWLCIC